MRLEQDRAAHHPAVDVLRHLDVIPVAVDPGAQEVLGQSLSTHMIV